MYKTCGKVDSSRSAIIVTTSSKKERLQDYLAVGDIHLTDDDVAAIDRAGAKGELWDERKGKVYGVIKWVSALGLGYLALRRLL